MGSNHQILNYYLSAWLAGIFTGVAIICGIVLLSSNTSADSTTANATVTVGSACTMTATVNTAHTAEVPAGSTKTNIGSTTLNTICNDVGGYAIYAVGYSGDEYGNNKMLNGTNEINTGTGSSASNWNMSLSQVTTGTYATTIDGGFGSYSAIPATFTKVAHRDSVTDAISGSSATGSSISLTYGAYISTTQATGDYVGKVRFTLVHPATETPPQPQTTESGKICYYPNGGNVEGTMGCQTISAFTTSTTLLASNFSREGYGFAGWSTTYDYSDATGFLGPQEEITFTAGQYTGSKPGLSLYAHWIKSAGNIQGWTGCSGLASGTVTALKDKRDNNTYAIAKLTDGNCWMIENMRLNNSNSDNSTGMLAQGYGERFVGLANEEGAPLFNNTTTANSLYSIDGSTSSTISGNSQGYRFPRYNRTNTPINVYDRPQNPTANNSSNGTSDAGMYSYGNYYTWAAAIADTTNYNTNNQSVANTSICPSGWHLPTGGGAYSSSATGDTNITGNINSYREYYYLGYTLMGIAAYENHAQQTAFYDESYTNTAGDTAVKAFRKYPNNFVFSGYIVNNTISARGNGSYYWSSTASTYLDNDVYGLGIYTNNVYPGTDSNKKYPGRTIRCLVSGV